MSFSIAKSEAKISGLLENDHGTTSIHATFSLGPYQVLNWYFKGFPVMSFNPYYAMEADGLNAVLIINTLSDAVTGEYTLKIEGTNIMDTIMFSLGKFK